MGAPGTGQITPDKAASGWRTRLYGWALAEQPENQALARACIRVLLIMYEEFFRNSLPLRASALTYSIILSIVPILALSTAILKGLGNDEELKTAIIRLVDQWEPPPPGTVSPCPPPAGGPAPGVAAPPETPPPETPAVSTSLHRAVDIIFEYVDRTNFTALGAFGVIGLVAVILLVLSSIEEAMNAIWHMDRGRSLSRKIMDYLALLIVLPLSLNVALAAEAILANDKIMRQLGQLLPAGWIWIAATLINLIPFVLIVLTLTMMYLFFPHRKVRPHAALTGAVSASVFWFLFQKLYITLQIGVAKYNAIYGSFASIPLFLIWMQIGWTCILLGASLAYAIQHHRHHRPRHDGQPPSPKHQLQLAFDLLDQVYADFDRRAPTTWERLQARLPQENPADLCAVAGLLRQNGLLQQSGPPDGAVLLPVTSRDQLAPSEVIRAILGNEPGTTRGGQLATIALLAAGREADQACPQGQAQAGNEADDHNQPSRNKSHAMGIHR